jgi:hypothetical protein
MKKILLGFIIILGAVVIVLNIIPVAAKSPVAVVPPKKTAGVMPAAIIPVPALATTTVAKTTSTKQNIQTVPPKPAPAVKKITPAKTTTASSGSTVHWAASGLKALGPISGFDYNYSIRSSFMRKVEAYARSRGITLITASVVNSMHE